MKFSVLMSVYNQEKPEYLKQSLDSLGTQTLIPTEVILVEDGPLNDDLYTIIKTFKQKINLKSIKLSKNSGLAIALNKGLEHCSYDLIARMDSDDISLPNRFEKQVEFMVCNPNIAVSSCSLNEFNDNGEVFSSRILPLSHEELVKFAKTRSPISHATAIFRKQAVLDVGGYPLFIRSQDVALWSLMIIKGYQLANLPDTLFHVRANADFMARSGLQSFKYEYAVIKYQKSIGFLSRFNFYKNIAIRLILAISPNSLKKIMYKLK